MEKAIVLYDLSNTLNNIDAYDRLYFGSEFCQLHLPTAEEIIKILSIAQQGNKNLTFLTPVCNDLGVKKIAYILEKYGKYLYAHDFEVVINDWGILDLLDKYPEVKKVVGRSLLNYKKDPRIGKFTSVPVELKYNESLSKYVRNFLFKYGCRRIEFDNLDYLLESVSPSKDIAFSVYIPYVCVTTTRLCRLQDENLYNRSNALKSHLNCDRKCEKIRLELKNKSVGKSLVVRGNTQYYETTILSEKWYEARGIDRLVYDII